MTSDPKPQDSRTAPQDPAAQTPEVKPRELDTQQLDDVTAGRKAGGQQQDYP